MEGVSRSLVETSGDSVNTTFPFLCVKHRKDNVLKKLNRKSGYCAKAKNYLLEDTTEAEQFPIMHGGPLHGRENQNNSEV